VVAQCRGHGTWHTIHMRLVVAGVDADGDSCLIEETEVSAPTAVLSAELIHQTITSPPPARAQGKSAHVDLEIPPGLARWMLVQYPAGHRTPMHHTDSIDFNTIISGSIELLLGDGSHRFGPGDCVVVTGVDHAWLPGPEGCTASVVVIGTPPRD